MLYAEMTTPITVAIIVTKANNSLYVTYISRKKNGCLCQEYRTTGNRFFIKGEALHLFIFQS